MKRISFKPEFHDKIRRGEKTGTIRRKELPGKPKVGDVVSAIGPNRFTKAVDGFITLKITEAFELPMEEAVKAGLLERTCASMSWYCNKYLDLQPHTPVWFYGWEITQ